MLKVGDVVRLNSARELMTVIEIKDDIVVVIWQSQEQISRHEFPMPCLTKVNAAAMGCDV